MNKVFNLIKKGLKYSFYCTTALTVTGYAYLQYVNSALGPINIDKQMALDFYKQQHKMGDAEATRTYYWVFFHISLARIMSFGTYKRACDRLATKIVEPTLANYGKQGILEELAGEKKKTSRSTFNKIVDIRKANTENIEVREYIIREIRTLQKEMHSNLLLGISEESRGRVDRIHEFICEAGRAFRDPEILRYISKLPDIEEKYPGDYLHKILFI
jgi:hypothetical protein